MDLFVTDCSITMCWCFEDEKDHYAIGILEQLARATAIVPAIWGLEVANALLMGERRKRLTEADSARFVAFLRSLPIIWDETPPGQMLDEVLALGRQHELSAYDATYLELAMREGVPLATLDDRLVAAAKTAGVEILAV